MSDNSNSTGSSGSSTNSWTLLSPEEAAGDNVGPVDDGTESLGDAPSLSEDMAAGAAMEFKPSDIPVESVLSEEGHQVCQETSPASGEGPIPSIPSPPSPYPPEPDTESQAPIIHDIVTSSPSDNEHLCSVPFVSSIDFLAPQDIAVAAADEPEDTLLDAALTERLVTEEPEADTPVRLAEESQVDVPTETTALSEVPSLVEPARAESDSPAHEDLVPETVCAAEEEPNEEEDVLMQEEEKEDEEFPASFNMEISSGHGLRRRAFQSSDTARSKASEEEDEEGEGEEEEDEEVELRLVEKDEDKSWWSMNKCVVGAAILLFLGSLFLSGDFDASEVSNGEPSQDRPSSSNLQEMKALLDKLMKENQRITLLETHLQSQINELDTAVSTSGDILEKADLERVSANLGEELSSMVHLKKELESLRARVTELSLLAADLESSETQPAPSSSAPGPAEPEKKGKVKEALKRQKVLLDESKTRLQGMKKDGGHRRAVTDSLEEIRRELSDQVERWGVRRSLGPQGKRSKSKDKERKGDKDGRKEEGKSPKPNSHKESWRKNQDEWETKKHERRQDREERRKEKPWHSRQASHQQQQSRKPHINAGDFWRDQEQKLKRNIRPRTSCTSVEDCAAKEGLYPVELPEFEELLDGYLSKLEGTPPFSKDAIRRLASTFFRDGVFMHDQVMFADFAEDVADILEDMVDVVEDGRRRGNDSLEEEMEEFEREALWKFATTA
uniref:pre-B-cell leukemia transcription factor-interacting protein 1 n=1 Tax=Doryrhamphus excisus TaxID=161450 RepID=UPI0025AE22D0|nr:pre-B-cell leukemia transcription factor-interacting protein 1 [Doryrhamphus excisus]XP_057902923.1 pre-B-cell leukemia transcription factor-interacting protein 1 [Doryrhamphus excisus]XP_057902924.1 pre-B-cell leukemia transcription factor-interacting protein 1 [Doryrhamphus excisus]XP_057902925.1 pre-B-cell leukemia transcription factor-interacting protein 1 [Doryrhamphus excisus]XP_057902926.1 pre-B-cell leukemia transcription factor-interacting protein 1 [Doryrhamphus excisus]